MNQNETINILTALVSFKVAAIKLSREWDNLKEGGEFTKDYPFNKSFDEVVLDITDWVNKSVDSLPKII